MEKYAKVSICGKYRYWLTRNWSSELNEHKKLVFIMLNPSTADAIDDDPTIRKCKGFAERLGFKGFKVVNLFSYRATNPKDLIKASKNGVNIVGISNYEEIKIAVFKARTVIVAWGANGDNTYLNGQAIAMMKDLQLWVPNKIKALSLTKSGQPCHPLMLPYSCKLIDLKL